LRSIATWTPICFIPNGVDLTLYENLPDRRSLELELPVLAGKFNLLFFGRLHVKKGLDLLAAAVGRVAAEYPALHLLVAGNDDGAWPVLRDRIAALGLTRRLTYVGHVAGERARQVWAAADAFILPSYSEGFSMAVLEAMACRLPSVITTACHFPEAGAAHAAIVVPPDPVSVTSALRGLLERSIPERAALGALGRRLVEDQFTWDRQAQRLTAVYEWLAGGGPPPDCVIT
jgi:glycosyltransferase involved in cell wall biosynthesis